MFAEALIDCSFPSQALLTRNVEVKDQILIKPDLVPLQDGPVVCGRHIACGADPNDSRLNSSALPMDGGPMDYMQKRQWINMDI